MTTPAAFLLPPNWSAPVAFTSAWKTDVLSGENAAEQRVSMRATPAESMRYTASLLTNEEQGRLLALLALAPTARFNIPRWFDSSLLLADLAIGGTSIVCDTTDRGFTVGGMALLWRRAANVFEVRTISAIAAGALTTDAATLAWLGNRDVEVMPIAPGRITLPVTRSSLGGVVADIVVGCEWEAAPVAVTAAIASTAQSLTLGADNHALGPGGFVCSHIGTYTIVYAEVLDADGVQIPEAVVTWTIADAVNFSIQPVGPTGQVAIVRNISAGLSTTTTVTATSGAATTTRGVIA